jgi:hypothetical protein
MQVLTTALGRPRDGRQHASAHHGAGAAKGWAGGAGTGGRHGGRLVELEARWRHGGRLVELDARWRHGGRLVELDARSPRARHLYLSKWTSVVSSRRVIVHVRCEMEVSLQVAPATRPLVACISYYDLKAKSRADEGDVVVDPRSS